MINPAIVVIAYNRLDSLKRLLKSLSSAIYNSESIPLIISIDKSDSTEVANYADTFDWKFGEKTVIKRPENLGLKKHVITCGNLVDTYDRIIVLEDDLYVSKSFYTYASQALDFSTSDNRIAGISLYNHLFNVHAREPFRAINDGYDNYYMQFAQSWGQAYTKEQWHGFTEWMKDNDLKPIEAIDVPLNVSTWSDKSWLKYYIKYIIETDKYFIYPRESYTTNFGDEGTHAESAVCDLQVPLASECKRNFIFSSIDDSKSIYDAFFENIVIKNIDGINFTMDLYGYKPIPESGYILTSKSLPKNIVKSFGRMLRPIDANICENINGNDFFLYDLSKDSNAPFISEAKRVLYNYRALNASKMIKVFKYRLFKK